MTNPTKPDPPDRDQHAPGISKTLEENATRFRETTTEERMEPKLRPVLPPHDTTPLMADRAVEHPVGGDPEMI